MRVKPTHYRAADTCTENTGGNLLRVLFNTGNSFLTRASSCANIILVLRL
jgi:hypothetical protein